MDGGPHHLLLCKGPDNRQAMPSCLPVPFSCITCQQQAVKPKIKCMVHPGVQQFLQTFVFLPAFPREVGIT